MNPDNQDSSPNQENTPPVDAPVSPVEQTPAAPLTPPEQPAPITEQVSKPVGGDKKKLYILIASIIGGLVIIGAAVWLLLSGGLFSSVNLRQYDNEYYSVLVPEGYEEEAGFSGGVKFTEPTDNLAQQAGVDITRQSNFGAELDDARINTAFDNFAKNLEEDDRYSDIEISRVDHKGNKAMRTSFTVESYDGTKGKSKGLVLVTSSATYLVVVGAPDSNPGLIKSADKILDSFTVK